MVKQKKSFVILLLITMLNLNNNVFANEDNHIEVTGTASILMERSTGRVIYEHNPDLTIYPASMTKVLTAMIALEYIEIDEIIVVGSEIDHVLPGSSRAGHVRGEHISGLNIIRGLIMPSGNDTANVVVANVASKVTGNPNLPFEEAEKIFAELMNQKAKELGAVNSNFTNAHGFHDPNLYSTVNDIAIIANAAMENEIIRMVAAETSYAGNSAGNNATRNMLTSEYNWHTHNRLLAGPYYNPNVTGLKTGFTDQAGHSLVATAEKDEVELISVVSGSVNPDRWTDTSALFQYGFNNYILETLQCTVEPLEEMKVYNPRLGDETSIEVFSNSEFIYYLTEDELKAVIKEITYDPQKIMVLEDESISLIAPISEGESIGKIVYKLNEDVIFTGDIVLKEDLYERTFLSSAHHVFKFLRENFFSIYGLSFILFCTFVGIVIHKIILFKRKFLRRRSNKYRI